jgi:hypothetical protein
MHVARAFDYAGSTLFSEFLRVVTSTYIQKKIYSCTTYSTSTSTALYTWQYVSSETSFSTAMYILLSLLLKGVAQAFSFNITEILNNTVLKY